MAEKKRCKRVPVEMKLMIPSLFRQNDVGLENIEAPIIIKNISRSGIGFVSEAIIPLDYYFRAEIILGEGEQKETMLLVIRILRKEEQDSKIFYGCEFVGKADILDQMFERFNEELMEWE